MTYLLSQLRNGPAKPLDASGSIWHLPPVPLLGSRGAKADAGLARLAVGGALLESSAPVYVHLPDQPDEDILVHLQEQGWGWRLLKPKPVLHYLFNEHREGDWFLWTSATPFGGPHPNAFRTSPDDLVTLMVHSDMSYFVESFHDDSEWIIGVHPEIASP